MSSFVSPARRPHIGMNSGNVQATSAVAGLALSHLEAIQLIRQNKEEGLRTLARARATNKYWTHAYDDIFGAMKRVVSSTMIACSDR
jgi:hypothetical protein